MLPGFGPRQFLDRLWLHPPSARANGFRFSGSWDATPTSQPATDLYDEREGRSRRLPGEG